MATPLPFAKLSHWHQVTFAAALLERMLPNYQMFSEAANFGEAKILRNQLDIIWQWLADSRAVKINTDAQLTKLVPQTPDPEAFDFFGVFPALDACMGLTTLWQLMQVKPAKKGKTDPLELEDIQSISRLSHNSVSRYVELLLAEELCDELDGEQAIGQAQIDEHPLMQWEMDTQHELFEFLQFAAADKRTCQLAKKMVLSEGMSNLGIEIN